MRPHPRTQSRTLRKGRPVLLRVAGRLEFVDAPGHAADPRWPSHRREQLICRPDRLRCSAGDGTGTARWQTSKAAGGMLGGRIGRREHRRPGHGGDGDRHDHGGPPEPDYPLTKADLAAEARKRNAPGQITTSSTGCRTGSTRRPTTWRRRRGRCTRAESRIGGLDAPPLETPNFSSARLGDPDGS